MGKRGPKNKPTEIKRIEGNPGKRALNENEPSFSAGVDCPEWLDDMARDEWNRLAPDLITNKLLDGGSIAAFATYCQAYSRLQAAEKIIANEGMFYVNNGRNGNQIKEHPAVKVALECKQFIRQMAPEFGCTPSSRSRFNLSIGGAKSKAQSESDDLDGFIKGTGFKVHSA
jgi:P27 family predicted phage terminase small subunit